MTILKFWVPSEQLLVGGILAPLNSTFAFCMMLIMTMSMTITRLCYRNKAILPLSLKRQLSYEKRNIKALKKAEGKQEISSLLNDLDRQSLSFIYKICRKTFKGNFCKIRKYDLDLFLQHENALKECFAHGHINRLHKKDIITSLYKTAELENGSVLKRLLYCFKP